MAYITLEELKEILPGILDQWIDEEDDSWEWIFQEIEQKCHVGKKYKKKDKKKWVFENLLAEFDVYKKSTDKLQHESVQQGLSIKDIQAEVRRLRDDIKVAKSMAETAKQRTEVDYTKYSQTDNKDKKYDQPITAANKCGSCKHLSKQPIDQPCIGCCYNGMNISGMDKWEAKDDE